MIFIYQNEAINECYPAACLTQKPQLTTFHQYRRAYGDMRINIIYFEFVNFGFYLVIGGIRRTVNFYDYDDIGIVAVCY